MSVRVNKTIKLFMGGAFPRTESGRSFAVKFANSDKLYANLCQASGKDFREAVEKAYSAHKQWSGMTAYLRGQILYRMAEMCEGKRSEFVTLFKDTLGWAQEKANQQVDAAIDAFVFYAGFSDKFSQLRGATNPVAGPYHCFTTPEAVGVVAHVSSDTFDFGKLVEQLASIIVSGNSVVSVLGSGCPAVIAPLAEVFMTSDLPGGVVNLLTGDTKELYPHAAKHREVRSLSYENENSQWLGEIQSLAAENMKRVFATAPTSPLKRILNFVEYKTAWHPVGQ